MKLNPFSTDFLEDPYPIYKYLRDHDPVHFNDELNFYAISRYDHVVEVLCDTTTYSNAQGVTLDGSGVGSGMLLTKDNPEHFAHKNLAFSLFTRQRMLAVENFARVKCVELLEEAGKRDECDAIEDFSVKLPLTVISELIGIPEDLREPIHKFADLMMARNADLDMTSVHNAKRLADETCRELIDSRRKTPRDDIITTLMTTPLVDAEGEVRYLTDAELTDRFIELAVAGHETVAKAIPNTMALFNRFPDELKTLLDNRSLLPGAIEEALRYEPPAQTQARTTTREVKLGGVTIPEKTRVLLLTGSATRDDRRFENPDVFDVTRENEVNSVYFGYGIHRCLGIHLARLEIRVAMEELLRRFPNYMTFPDRGARKAMANVRGYSHLPLRLGPHA